LYYYFCLVSFLLFVL